MTDMTINRLERINVYDIGDPTPSHIFYVAHTGPDFWFNTVMPEICKRFDVGDSDIDCLLVFCGGKFNEDRAVEVITIAGEIVASFDEMISINDVAAIKANRDNFRPKR